MSLALDDLSRDPDQLLGHLQQMTEVIARQNASLASLQVERDSFLAERDLIREKHDTAQAEIEKLRLLIRQLQRGQFGRRSERLDPDQLQLGLEDLEQTAAAAEAAQEELAARNSTPRPPRVRRRNLGSLPAHLPRVEVLVDVADKSCPCCGGALHVIGEDTSEMLDLVPAQLRVKVIRRPRYGCRACEEEVVQAPAPERPITGGMATEVDLTLGSGGFANEPQHPRRTGWRRGGPGAGSRPSSRWRRSSGCSRVAEGSRRSRPSWG
jgi:hypothetical protein